MSGWTRPGRKQISQWLDGWIGRHSSLGDPFVVRAEQLYMLFGSNLGWYWDVSDVGRAPHPQTGEACAFTGLYKFLDETMAAKKAKRERGEIR